MPTDAATRASVNNYIPLLAVFFVIFFTTQAQEARGEWLNSLPINPTLAAAARNGFANPDSVGYLEVHHGSYGGPLGPYSVQVPSNQPPGDTIGVRGAGKIDWQPGLARLCQSATFSMSGLIPGAIAFGTMSAGIRAEGYWASLANEFARFTADWHFIGSVAPGYSVRIIALGDITPGPPGQGTPSLIRYQYDFPVFTSSFDVEQIYASPWVPDAQLIPAGTSYLTITESIQVDITIDDRSKALQGGTTTVTLLDPFGLGSTFNPNPAPEPASLVLMSLGAAILGVFGMRRRNRRPLR